jgi:phosphoglycolate phosphatase
MTPRAALLDLDGTLIDSGRSVIAAMRRTMAELGHSLPEDEDLSWVIGPPLRDIFTRLLLPFDDPRVEEAMARYIARYDAGGYADAAVFPGIPAALAAFRDDGWRLFVATSKGLSIARRLLAEFDLTGYFGGIYGSSDDDQLAHKPELIAHVMAREGLVAEGSVMIGDRSFDISGAHANALRAIGVLWGYGGEEELIQAGADALASDPSDLLTLARGLLRHTSTETR